MAKSYQVDGTTYQFPDEYSDSQVQDILTQQGIIKGAPPAHSATGFLGNAVQSGANYLGGMYQAFRHPLDTIGNVADLGAGVVNQGLVASGLSKESDLKPEAAAALAKARAVEDNYKQRYGGLSNIAETAYTDPVGMMGDVSALAGGAGSLLKAGRMARAAEVAGKVSQVTNPINMAAAPARMAVSAVAGDRAGAMANRMYQSALKPSNRLTADQKAALIQTGLNERIPVSNSGLEKTYDAIDHLGNQGSGIIQKGAAAGDTIDPYAVAQRVDQKIPQFQDQVNPAADIEALRGTKQKFLDEHTITRPATGLLGPTGAPIPPAPPQPVPIPVDAAQRIKQGTYVQLRKSYGKLGNAEAEGQKALARGLKEEIAAKYPGLTDINARESRLISLSDALEKATGRIGNHQLFGIGTPLAMGAGSAVLGKGMGALIGGGRAILEHPVTKSEAAILLNRLKLQKGISPFPSGNTSGLLNVGSRISRGLLDQ